MADERASARNASRGIVPWLGLAGGPLLGVIVYALVPEAELAHAGRATLALMAWMATWWFTEAVHVSATALLPVALLPLVTVGAEASARGAITAAAAPYANRFIALFMGGFMLALAMERWGLHKRIALLTLRCVGTRPVNIVAGFMTVTAVLSMWVSNTATTVMMLPIALSVAGLLADNDSAPAAGGGGTRATRANLPLCLMLAIAYAASVGGIGTLIGTPPNTFLAGFLEDRYEMKIGFARWLAVGLPLVAVFVPLIWLLLTRVLYPVPTTPLTGARDLLRESYAALGSTSRGEWITLIVFLVTAAAWVTRPLLTDLSIGGRQPLAGLTDPGIAILAALALFVIPVDLGSRTFALDWEWARRLPWGILILFGGGLSLAGAVERHGVSDFLGHQAEALTGLPTLLIVVTVAAGVIFLTELTSNTATTTTLLPILAGVAPALGLDPILLLVPATVAASCAFMMPVATPPNAIVFGSGHVTIPQMCKAGLWLNLIGVVLVTLLAYAVAMPLLGGG